MTWTSWSDFVAMGGYGLYVWGSVGAAAVVVVAECWSLRRRRAALLAADAPFDAAGAVFDARYEGLPHEA